MAKGILIEADDATQSAVDRRIDNNQYRYNVLSPASDRTEFELSADGGKTVARDYIDRFNKHAETMLSKEIYMKNPEQFFANLKRLTEIKINNKVDQNNKNRRREIEWELVDMEEGLDEKFLPPAIIATVVRIIEKDGVKEKSDELSNKFMLVPEFNDFKLKPNDNIYAKDYDNIVAADDAMVIGHAGKGLILSFDATISGHTIHVTSSREELDQPGHAKQYWLRPLKYFAEYVIKDATGILDRKLYSSLFKDMQNVPNVDDSHPGKNSAKGPGWYFGHLQNTLDTDDALIKRAVDEFPEDGIDGVRTDLGLFTDQDEAEDYQARVDRIFRRAKGIPDDDVETELKFNNTSDDELGSMGISIPKNANGKIDRDSFLRNMKGEGIKAATAKPAAAKPENAASSAPEAHMTLKQRLEQQRKARLDAAKKAEAKGVTESQEVFVHDPYAHFTATASDKQLEDASRYGRYASKYNREKLANLVTGGSVSSTPIQRQPSRSNSAIDDAIDSSYYGDDTPPDYMPPPSAPAQMLAPVDKLKINIPGGPSDKSVITRESIQRKQEQPVPIVQAPAVAPAPASKAAPPKAAPPKAVPPQEPEKSSQDILREKVLRAVLNTQRNRNLGPQQTLELAKTALKRYKINTDEDTDELIDTDLNMLRAQK